MGKPEIRTVKTFKINFRAYGSAEIEAEDEEGAIDALYTEYSDPNVWKFEIDHIEEN